MKNIIFDKNKSIHEGRRQYVAPSCIILDVISSGIVADSAAYVYTPGLGFDDEDEKNNPISAYRGNIWDEGTIFDGSL